MDNMLYSAYATLAAALVVCGLLIWVVYAKNKALPILLAILAFVGTLIAIKVWWLLTIVTLVILVIGFVIWQENKQTLSHR
ncbi:MAG: hypothetical protein ACAH17_02450 [Candidatus Paceibacterota bacterium]